MELAGDVGEVLSSRQPSLLQLAGDVLPHLRALILSLLW
jgi:hypothetical protein